MDTHAHFMKAALTAAQNALAAGEFPVGCVLVCDGEVVVTGARTGTAGGGGNEVDHAEMDALRQLAALPSPPPPSRVTAYCTMEPCLMCFSALMLARIAAVVYAYEDVMGGGTRCDRGRLAPLYRDAAITVVPGVMRAESLALFQRFFRNPAHRYWEGSLLCRYTLDQ